jgi:hypothetical protein
MSFILHISAQVGVLSFPSLTICTDTCSQPSPSEAITKAVVRLLNGISKAPLLPNVLSLDKTPFFTLY